MHLQDLNISFSVQTLSCSKVTIVLTGTSSLPLLVPATSWWPFCVTPEAFLAAITCPQHHLVLPRSRIRLHGSVSLQSGVTWFPVCGTCAQVVCAISRVGPKTFNLLPSWPLSFPPVGTSNHSFQTLQMITVS